jgi:hypothetical protein
MLYQGYYMKDDEMQLRTYLMVLISCRIQAIFNVSWNALIAELLSGNMYSRLLKCNFFSMVCNHT